MPVFCNISSASGLERTDCPGSNGVNLPAFLWTAHAQSGFSDFNGRMQRDHKAMMWRKRLDLVLFFVTILLMTTEPRKSGDQAQPVAYKRQDDLTTPSAEGNHG